VQKYHIPIIKHTQEVYFQEISEYVIYGNSYNTVSSVWRAGSGNYQPTITCTTGGLINIVFAYNTSATGYLFWSFAILLL